jgi:hypothetical protein
MATVTPIAGGRRTPATGEEVLRDGARLLADYFVRALDRIPPDDPHRAMIEIDAARFRALGGA